MVFLWKNKTKETKTNYTRVPSCHQRTLRLRKVRVSRRSCSANVSWPFAFLPTYSFQKRTDCPTFNTHATQASDKIWELHQPGTSGVCWVHLLSNKPLSSNAVVPIVTIQVVGHENLQAKQLFHSSPFGSQMASLCSPFSSPDSSPGPF